jgi:nucleotide-binding universal stress UspA family protein
MYNKIFLPTDGSEHAEVALEHAIDLAQKYDAQLHVLYVVDVRANSGFNMWPDMLEELQAVGKEVTQEIADKAEKSGIEVITEVKTGIPYKEINTYIRENDIDLITMGTRGKTGLDRILLGSVTEKIIRTSQVPVLTVGSKK